MSLLIKNGRLIDPAHAMDGKHAAIVALGDRRRIACAPRLNGDGCGGRRLCALGVVLREESAPR